MIASTCMRIRGMEPSAHFRRICLPLALLTGLAIGLRSTAEAYAQEVAQCEGSDCAHIFVENGLDAGVGYEHLSPGGHNLRMILDAGEGALVDGTRIVDSVGINIWNLESPNHSGRDARQHIYITAAVLANDAHAVIFRGRVKPDGAGGGPRPAGGGGGQALQFLLTVNEVDLDADTNNNSLDPHRPPEGTSEEDELEGSPFLQSELPGLIFGVNDNHDIDLHDGQWRMRDYAHPLNLDVDPDTPRLNLAIRRKDAGQFEIVSALEIFDEDGVRQDEDGFDNEVPAPGTGRIAEFSKDLYCQASSPGPGSLIAIFMPANFIDESLIEANVAPPEDHIKFHALRADVDVDSDRSGGVSSSNDPAAGQDFIEIAPGNPGAIVSMGGTRSPGLLSLDGIIDSAVIAYLANQYSASVKLTAMVAGGQDGGQVRVFGIPSDPDSGPVLLLEALQEGHSSDAFDGEPLLDRLFPHSLAVLIEGVRAGQVELELSVELDDTNLVVHRDRIRLMVVDALNFVRHDDSDAGRWVPLYTGLGPDDNTGGGSPRMSIPNLPAEVVGDTYALTAAQVRAFDPFTFVTRIEVAVIDLDSASAAYTWQSLALSDEDPPALGDPYESRLADDYELTGLNAFRSSAPLGARRRYVFRAQNALGRYAYDEFLLEVALDASGARELRSSNPLPGALGMNGWTGMDDRVVLKLHFNINHAPPEGEALALSSPLYHPVAQGGGFALESGSSFTAAQVATLPERFVIVDQARLTLRPGGQQQTHMFPHVRLDFSNFGQPQSDDHKLRADYPLAEMALGVPFTCSDEVEPIDINLRLFLADDDIEATIPVTIRFNSESVDANNVEQWKPLMRPGQLITFPNTPGIFNPVEAISEGSVHIEAVDGVANISVFQSLVEGLGWGPWQPVSLRLEFSPQELRNPLQRRRFLVNGVANRGEALLRLRYRYLNRDVIVDDMRVAVREIPGVAGDELTSAPFFDFVRTFNADDQLVSGAIDPFAWPHLTRNMSLPMADGDKPQAQVFIVPHRSAAEWAATPSIPNDYPSGVVRLDGSCLRLNRIGIWPNLPAGSYDVIVDIANSGGENQPNGQLDPGDIIGRLTTGAANHHLAAELQILSDPGTVAQYATTSFVEFTEGYFDTGGGRAFARLRGRLQYPDDGGAFTPTTPRIRGVRGRTPNGTVTNITPHGVTESEFYLATFDGANWWVRRATQSQETAVGSYAVTVVGPPRVWTIDTRANGGNVEFTVTEGATAFEAGDEVYFTVRRGVRTDGPFPLVVVAHGNHNAYRPSQPKYGTPAVIGGRLVLRADPGANGINDQYMTIVDKDLAVGSETFIVVWVPPSMAAPGRWDIIVPGVAVVGSTPSDALFQIPAGAGHNSRFSLRIEAAAEAVGRGFWITTANNALTSNENYRGHDAVLQHLARNGFCALSISLDDLITADIDDTWGGSGLGINERASVVDEMVRRWLTNSGNLRTHLGLDGQIDFSDITLIGHSRGGETVARAANLGAPVGSAYGQVVSISPTTALPAGDTEAPIPFLGVYGSHDGDVWWGGAFMLYDRCSAEKQAVFLTRANHNFFNRSWPANDDPSGESHAFNGAADATAARSAHEAVLASYATAFLFVHTRNQTWYRDYFRRGSRLLPPIVGQSVAHVQYRFPAGGLTVDDYETAPNAPTPNELGGAVDHARIENDAESVGAAGDFQLQFNPAPTGFDPVTGHPLFPVDGDFRFHQWTHAEQLRWDNVVPPTYATLLPAAYRDVSNLGTLTFRCGQRFGAPGNSAELSVTVQLIDSGGRVASLASEVFGAIAQPVERPAGHLGPMHPWAPAWSSTSKGHFVTTRIPLSAFQTSRHHQNQIDLGNLERVRLVFDDRIQGTVAIDDIAIEVDQ